MGAIPPFAFYRAAYAQGSKRTDPNVQADQDPAARIARARRQRRARSGAPRRRLGHRAHDGADPLSLFGRSRTRMDGGARARGVRARGDVRRGAGRRDRLYPRRRQVVGRDRVLDRAAVVETRVRQRGRGRPRAPLLHGRRLQTSHVLPFRRQPRLRGRHPQARLPAQGRALRLVRRAAGGNSHAVL